MKYGQGYTYTGEVDNNGKRCGYGFSIQDETLYYCWGTYLNDQNLGISKSIAKFSFISILVVEKDPTRGEKGYEYEI